MKNTIVIVFVIFVACLVYGSPVENGQHYTDEYDHINVDEILGNERIFNNYYNCIKTGNKCTPAGAKLKELLPEAFQTKCERCTDIQRTQARRVIDYVARNKPDKFKEIEDLFDKEHHYRKMYAEELKQAGIILPD